MKIFLHFIVLGLLNIFFFQARSQPNPYCGEENNKNKPTSGNNINSKPVNNSRFSSTTYYPANCDSLSLFNYYPYDSSNTKSICLHFIINTDSVGNPIGGITKEDIDFLMLNTNAILNPHKFNYCYYDISYSSLPYQEAVPFEELIQYVYIGDIDVAGRAGNPAQLDYTYVMNKGSLGDNVFAHELAHNNGLNHAPDINNLMYYAIAGGSFLDSTQIAIMHCATERIYYMFEWVNHPYYVVDLDFSNEVCNNPGKPYARFYTNNYGGCVPLQVPFYDSTFFNPEKWYWDFGDGSYDTTANPVHTYTKTGIYNITLVVSNNYGSDTLTKNNYIVATDTVYSLPIYEDFEDTSDSWFTPSKDWYVENPDYLNIYFKKYNNGVPAPQTGTTCIRIIEPGFYPNSGTLPTIGARVNSLVMPPMDLRYVKNPYLTYNYAYPLIQDYLNGDKIYIYASTDCGNSFTEVYKKYEDLLAIGFKNDSTNILGTIFIPYDSVQYRYDNFYPYTSEAWKKDSINLSSLEGEDSVILKYTFLSNSLRYLYLDDILISADKISGLPVADFKADTTTIYKYDTVRFTNLSTFSDTLQWLFTGATIASTQDTNPSIVYDSVGIFPVTLVVWNMFGKDTLTKLAYINVLQKIIDTIPCDSMKIILSKNDLSCKDKNDGTVTVSAFNGNTPYSFAWSTGDTTNSISGLAAGSYAVTITDSIGCTKTDSVKISYTYTLPVAGFTYSDTIIKIYFTNLSTNADSYLWIFGDNSTDTTTSPLHIYSDLGIYIACLIASNSCGSDTVCDSISIVDGVKENTNKVDLKIYPNPNSGTFTIIIEQPQAGKIQLTLTNILGQEVYSATTKNKIFKEEIDLSNFSKGLYSLKLVTNDASISKKIIYR